MKQLKEIIKYNHLNLEVPEGMTAEQALQFYANNYPELSVATLKPPVDTGDERIYEVASRNVGVKG